MGERRIAMHDIGIGYIEKGVHTIYITSWVLSDEVGGVHIRTGLLSLKDGSDLNAELEKAATSDYEGLSVQQVTYQPLAEMLNELCDEYLALGILQQFDENVDKGEGDK